MSGYEHDHCTRREMELEARIAELERMVVWAVRHGASEGYDGSSWPCIWYSAVERHRDVLCSREQSIGHDGTPAGILAALKEVMGDGE